MLVFDTLQVSSLPYFRTDTLTLIAPYHHIARQQVSSTVHFAPFW
uniref:Uncharacterized protein n=1 Tax=Arundo donax TaxID=35708 RepID=A0A0A9C9V2_ARUDO